GVALLLLQEPAARSPCLPGARPLHSADKAEEHPALAHGRGADHAPRPGVLPGVRRGVRAACRPLRRHDDRSKARRLEDASRRLAFGYLRLVAEVPIIE